MENVKIEAQIRADVGKGASRRLRRADKVPAILYGNHITPQALEFEHRHIIPLMKNRALSSQVFDLVIGKETHQVLVKNLERHVYKNKAMHLEFQALSAKEKVSLEIPFTFINEDTCDGVKKGGELSINMKSARVRCLPGAIPETIEIDLQNFGLETVLHLSEVTWPKGVESQDLMLGSEHDLAILAVHAPKGAVAEAVDQEGAAE